MPNFKKFYNLLTEQYDFACLMIPIWDASIYELSIKNIKEEDLYVGDEAGKGDKGRVSDSHVTVLYGTKDSDLEKIKELCKYEKPFEITLGKISLFEQEKFDVLKIEVTSGKLSAIHNLLKNSIPNEYGFPTYQAHITLAYIKKGTCRELIGNNSFEGKTFIVTSFAYTMTNGRKEIVDLNNGSYTNFPVPPIVSR